MTDAVAGGAAVADVEPLPGGPDGADEMAASTRDTETKGERTRRRLLEIAIERFGDRGYRATSVSEVARAAGLTQAAVYAYVPSKEALFDAAVDADAASALGETMEKTLDTPANALVPMMLFVLVGNMDRHPLVKRVLAGEESDALQRLIDLPALADLTASIATRVRDAQAAGDVRSDLDPELFSNGAEAILVSLLMSIVQVGSSTATRRQIGVVSIFDTLLRPPPSAAPAENL
jgi:AcrR family transcriptional regulator